MNIAPLLSRCSRAEHTSVMHQEEGGRGVGMDGSAVKCLGC